MSEKTVCCAVCGSLGAFHYESLAKDGWKRYYNGKWLCSACLPIVADEMSKENEDQKLLDMFAVAALQGWLAGGSPYQASNVIAEWAYDLAEAMTNERRKRTEGKK